MALLKAVAIFYRIVLLSDIFSVSFLSIFVYILKSTVSMQADCQWATYAMPKDFGIYAMSIINIETQWFLLLFK